ncbi:DUF6053 domain-containing protein [Lysobacter enzymogenes]|uniref:DUF6053 domain-containing protein n=1 Tax=Lysobacter enzymogenes TaxID=69 RepID=UPI003CCCF0B7
MGAIIACQPGPGFAWLAGLSGPGPALVGGPSGPMPLAQVAAIRAKGIGPEGPPARPPKRISPAPLHRARALA